MKLSDYVANFIESIGVKHVFLLPGGGCMHLVDSIGKSNLIPIGCLHEQSAVIAADAYSQYTGNIGIALVTTGPGATNAITGVAGAYLDSTPLLVISGQVKTSDIAPAGLRQMGMQEVDIVSIVKSITKYAITITDPTDIKYQLEKAVQIAKSGRPGPVWIDITLDVQAIEISEQEAEVNDYLNGFIPSDVTHSAKIVRDSYLNTKFQSQVSETISLLSTAKRPVLLIGNGARSSPTLNKFINHLNIPTLTTWKAADLLPEDHPLYFGRPGIIGQRCANFIQQKADLLITVGARLDFGQIGYDHSNFAPNAKKVIVDIDQNELNKFNTDIDISIEISANDFMEQTKKRKCGKTNISKWINTCVDWYQKYPVYTHPPQSKFINTYDLIHYISEYATASDIIVPDSSGSAAEITLQSFRIKKGQRLIFNPGLGSMGYGLPAAIGAAIASGKRTICIIGDGSLQHNIQELETMHRLNLPIKLFVLNNNGYASIRNTHNTHFNGNLVCCDPSSGLTLPSTFDIAKAYGFPSFRIIYGDTMEFIIQDTLKYPGPVICEVMVDPDLKTLPRVSSKLNSNGEMVSAAFEDLYPFLPRKEFNKVMEIKS